MQNHGTSTTHVDGLFSVGAHFGYTKSRRHPSMSPFIFGTKNRVEIFDLETTSFALEKATSFIRDIAKTGKTILLVSGKAEATPVVKRIADRLGVPYVAGRFVGGTLTNFGQIRKRVDRLQSLLQEKEQGGLSRYTKKERLLLDREIERLTKDFGGIVSMTSLPSAIVIIDPRQEKNVIAEAKRMHIPTVGLLNSDCDLKTVTYAVPGNDALQKSIDFFLTKIADAFEEGKRGTASV
jgi:small subunit ribosomal protein S2